MARKKHGVVVQLSAFTLYRHPIPGSDNPLYGLAEQDLTGKTRAKSVDIRTRSTAHDLPRVSAQVEHAVMIHKRHDMRQGHLQGYLRRLRPKGAAHRNDVMTNKSFRITARLKVFTQRLFRLVSHHRRSSTVKPANIREHPIVGRGEQISSVAEQARKVRRAILQTGISATHTK